MNVQIRFQHVMTFLVIATLWMSLEPAAAQTREITPEDYLAFKSLNDVRISPDGSTVAFAVGTIDQKQNRRYNAIWTVPADGSREPSLLTTSAQSSSSPRWSPDGRSLAFLSARPVPGETVAESQRNQIWLLPLGGGEPRRITSLKNGVNSFVWAP